MKDSGDTSDVTKSGIQISDTKSEIAESVTHMGIITSDVTQPVHILNTLVKTDYQ